jgi:carbon monoxide dehydrogenase subunit G
MVTPSCCVIDYEGHFDFDVAPEVLWSAMADVRHFESWLGWLADLALVGDGLVAGAVLVGTVSPPLPYRMRVEVRLEHCEAPRWIDATVRGDLEGSAQVSLEPAGHGTRVEAAWTIEMMQRPMRLAARVAHPLLRWGHDVVVEATVRGFRTHARQLARR